MNRSNSAAEVSLTASEPYTVGEQGVLLQAGVETAIVLTFAPVGVGTFVGAATLRSGDEVISVALAGDGIAFPCPTVPCSSFTYNVENSACIEHSVANGTPCEDRCLDAPVCIGGRCSGVPKLCNDANACTADSCQPGVGCVNRDTANECPSAPDSCQASACRADAGCVIEPVEDGSACGAAACLAAQQCLAGSCASRELSASNTCDVPVRLRRGANVVCGVTAGKRVRCWGRVPTVGSSSVPTDLPLPPFDDFTFIRNESVCILTPAKTVECWGWTPEMGITASSPQVVSGLSDVTHLSGSIDYACVQTADAGVSCWGDNHLGQLGDGTKTSRASPSRVESLLDVRVVQATGYTPCAIHGDGGLSCWGNNFEGAVGDGTYIDRPWPVPVPMSAPVIRLGQIESTRVVLADGSARAWGYNNQNNVGPGTSDYTTPFDVGLTDVSEIAGTWKASCALRNDGTVWCWGNNEDGALGDPSATGRVWPPRKVPNITNAVQLVATLATFCVLTAEGRPYCWGGNLAGEVGDGTVISRASPTPVLW